MSSSQLIPLGACSSSLPSEALAEQVEISVPPNARLGISLIAVPDGIKVAGLAEQGLAKAHLGKGDIILAVNDSTVSSEKVGNKLLAAAAASGFASLKVIRSRSTRSTSSDSPVSLKVIEILPQRSRTGDVPDDSAI